MAKNIFPEKYGAKLEFLVWSGGLQMEKGRGGRVGISIFPGTAVTKNLSDTVQRYSCSFHMLITFSFYHYQMNVNKKTFFTAFLSVALQV